MLAHGDLAANPVPAKFEEADLPIMHMSESCRRRLRQCVQGMGRTPGDRSRLRSPALIAQNLMNESRQCDDYSVGGGC